MHGSRRRLSALLDVAKRFVAPIVVILPGRPRALLLLFLPDAMPVGEVDESFASRAGRHPGSRQCLMQSIGTLLGNKFWRADPQEPFA